MEDILYLAFSDPDDSLDLLKEELEKVKICLSPLENRGYIKIDADRHTTTSDLRRKMADPAFTEHLAVFHFSGHAHEDALLLEDVEGQGDGLACLLGQCSSLQLVFLNGCATAGHFERLKKQGVRAVIGTRRKVFDEVARDFSVAFYQALANKHTLQRAFTFARQMVQAKYRDAPACSIQRSLFLREEHSLIQEWLLGVQDEEALNWRLPYYRAFSLPGKLQAHINGLAGDKFLAGVLNEMCRYNKDIYTQMVEVRAGEEQARDSSVFPELVIQNFPWAVGSQIQLLRQQRQADAMHLRLIVSAYLRLGQVFFYILLSDLWEGVHYKRAAPIPSLLDNWPPQGKDACRNFDYFQSAARILESMKAAGLPLFVPELEHFFDEKTRKVIGYFEELRRNMAVMNPVSECEIAESGLGHLLQRAAFLTSYQMLTVRDMRIDRPRFEVESYDLEHGRLNGIAHTSLAIYKDKHHRRKNTYANSESVVLAYYEGGLDHYLNLSPFIVDVNTFLGNETPDLFLYGYEGAGIHHYLKANHAFYDTLDNANGMEIMDTTLTLEAYLEGGNDKARPPWEEGLPEPPPAGNTHSVFAVLEAQLETLRSDFKITISTDGP